MNNDLEISQKDLGQSQKVLDILTLCASVFIAIIIIQTNLVPYEAGTGDHHVILPAGLLRANPNLYLGDFFIREAVMPHWFFEYLTTFAHQLNQLNLFFFFYWVFTIAVFAYANLLIAKTVMENNARVTAVLMIAIQVLGVRTMFGTSAIILQQALPHTLAASVTFLILALWLRGERTAIFFILPLVSIIHIQIGAIALGLLVLLVANEWRHNFDHKIKSLVSLLASGFTTLFGLVLRPVAGNTQEFSEICQRLIPHHCYAPSWSIENIALCAIFIALGLAVALLVQEHRVRRSFLIIVIGLPVSVLMCSLLLDRFSNGIATDLVRGNNVYRLAVVVLPFIYWSPLLIWKSRPGQAGRLFAFVVTSSLLVFMVLLPGHGSRFASTPFLAVCVFMVVGVAYLCRSIARDSVKREVLLIIAFSIITSIGVMTFNERSFTRPYIQFIPDAQQRAFGKALANSVQEGQVVAGDPITYWLRMDSGVGYAVDCKFRPIGGGKPLEEFYDRLKPLGGYESACLNYSYDSVAASDLDNFARESDAPLLLLKTSDNRIVALSSLGWEKLSNPDLETFGYLLLNLRS